MRIGNYAIDAGMWFNSGRSCANFGIRVSTRHTGDHSPAVYVNIDLVFVEFEWSAYNVNHEEDEDAP